MPAAPTPASACVDPTRCPLCGAANGCAMEAERATGVKQPPCWCTGVTFGPDLLARVPAAAQNQACICLRCATATPSSDPQDTSK